MQDNLAYRYFAFISYSSKDKKVAEKIQDKIESYRLPTVLRNELEAATGKKYPQRVKPLFRDTTDLSAGLLGKSILRELEDSRFLLVVCSPDSAKSEWVNQEVENFILMGRYERIIPFIIEGVPNSGDPATECFPPILRKKREFISYSHLTPEVNVERQTKLHALLDPISDELKGISISGEGPRISRLKVIARMLEVAPDTLIQRDKQRQKKTFILLSSIAAFFMIFLTCLGLWIWDRYYRVHEGYYADYVEYWGVPKGIFPLTPKQCERRTEHYRIYTQNKRVIRLEHVNSAGTPVPVTNTELQDRPMIADYEYNNKDGRLVQRKDLDNNGKVIMSNLYSGDKMQKVEFKSIGDDKTSSSTVLTSITSLSKPLQDTSMGKHGEIGNMRFKRDNEGRVIEVHFQKGGSDVSTTDEQGIAGFQFILDDYGRIVERIYLGRDGNPCPDKQGVARRKTWYDDNGNLVWAKYFDTNGNLTFNELEWMHCINKFDEYGNYIEEKFLDSSGALCLDNSGVAGWKCNLDEHGNAIEFVMFDVDAKPCLCKDGYAKLTRKFNNQGNIIEEKYSDIDGQPCLNQQGFARVAAKFDKRGNVTEVAFFDIDDKPCLNKNGYAKYTIKYDERGNQIELAYYGIDDKLCLIIDGYARYTIKYDERGNIIELAYYGSDNKPCRHKDGNAIVRWKHDERGNRIEEAFLGIDGQPCRINDNYSKTTWKYDERGNEIEIRYFGTDNQPCLYIDGYAKIAKKYDKRGNQIELAYYGIDDKPCRHKDGYAIVKWKYDERGNQIEEAYFDIDGQPFRIKDGYAKVTMKYDKRGYKTENAYFDVDGQPVRITDGYAKFTWKYDERGNKIEVAYFDIDGQPCLNEERVAKCIYKYDKRGNQIEESYFDTQYKPCLQKNCYFRATGKYDERGNLIEAAAFDIDGLPCLHEKGYAGITIKYDERGNQIEKRCFGIDGQPYRCNEGYTKCLYKYDERGNQTEEAYFDGDDPCLSVDGFAGFKSKFDERGNEIEVAYFGIDGQPCQRKSGYAKLIRKYDERGNKTEVAYLDVDNNPCLSDEGIAGFKTQYDEKAREIRKEFFGADGKPCVLAGDDPYVACETTYYDNGVMAKQTWFYAIKPYKGILGKWIQEYDEHGNIILTYYLDTNDNSCLNEEEIAGFKTQYDEKNREVHREFFGVDGKACVLGGDDPYTGWEKSYYEDGTRAKQTWFYTIKPYKGILGKWIQEYDEHENNIATYYLDMNDKPCLCDDGYAKITRKYDDHGNQIEVAYFGVDDKPCLRDEDIAGFKTQYDEKNREVHREFFGVDGKACVLGGDDPYTGWEKSYYENGVKSKQTWFYTIKPYKNILGKLIKEYDERGNNITTYYFDKDDKPCLCDDGYAKITRKFDDQGNQTEIAYFGVDDKPCLSVEEIAGFKSQYDEKNREVHREFFDVDGKACVLGGDDPYTGWEKTYYENGAMSKQTWFFAIKPYKGILGKWIQEYDEHGNIILTYYLDTNDNSCLNEEEIAGFKSQFDEKNREVRREFFGVDGKPCVLGGDNPYTGLEKTYYENDVMSKQTWFYAIKPYKGILGKWIQEYDEHGNNITTYYLNMDDKPCLHDSGYARITRKFDDKGNQTEIAYFGVDDKPCLSVEEIAGFKSQYDEKNREVHREFFDVDGKACVLGGDDPYTGWEKSYYENGVKSKQTWFYTIKPYKNILGKLIKEYDERGNNTSMYFLDKDDKPCLNNYGYAKSTRIFDENDNQTEVAYFGVDDKPCLSVEEIAGFKSQYDEKNREVHREFFDVDGKPCVLGGDNPYTGLEKTYYENGVKSKQTWFYAIKPYKGILGKWIQEYDEHGNIILTYYLDTNDNSCLNEEEIAGFKSQFDEKNREIRREFFGVDGKACVLGGDDPYTGWEKSYYENGVKSKQTWFYTIKPYKNILGKWVNEYDERGNNTLTYYLDMDDNPCLRDNGYAKSIAKYDDQGNIIEIMYFDINDQPCLHKNGYAKITRKFDEQNNPTEEAYFAIDGKPCLNKEYNCSKVSWEYDQQGNVIKTRCCDIYGKEALLCVIVKETFPGSNAEKYKIKKGDFFILYDGQPVDDADSFIKNRSKETGDDPHELVVLRGNEFVVIQMRPGLLGGVLGPWVPTEEQQKLVMEKLKEVKKD